jgi:hypothetical protein
MPSPAVLLRPAVLSAAPAAFSPSSSLLLRCPARLTYSTVARPWTQTTLESNPRIHVFQQAGSPSILLHLLPNTPPNPALAIGGTSSLPPSPRTFRANPAFLAHLSATLLAHGAADPGLRALASGNMGKPAGHVHLSDARRPPDVGRVADPQDILGSVRVDEQGEVQGQLEESGTYRVVTNDGILGLSDFLLDKLTSRLAEEDAKKRQAS